MRLSKIKTAGFKSFVDPTIIDLRSNLTGIVGPNGCGKSNTIDAVRWVMGESSAKHLRGASMDDVIFNGSSSRKPIGQASVELLFDNSDGGLGGEYATFSEIAIKRLISRDGQSKYFLNGSRCRRRDITDIFLGTGLGPRSYAIIEQGMISRLIEAKPEELRNTIEEAAGISKYKERRRETETRIRHTRENLERLSDLREEMEKQLAHLKRQSKAAEKYKTFKETERRLNAELILLRLNKVQQDITARQAIINENATTHQAELSQQRSLENQIESQREAHTSANNAFNKIQAVFYQVGSEISRIEQSIRHQNELEKRLQTDLEQIDIEIEESQTDAGKDKQQLETATQALAEIKPLLTVELKELDKESALLEKNERALAEWQKKWTVFQQRLAEPAQKAQIERARMEQFESQISHTASRLSKLHSEQGLFSSDAVNKELKEQHKLLETTQQKHKQAKQCFEQGDFTLKKQKNTLKEQLQEQQEIRSQLQVLTGKLSSLDVLQNAEHQKLAGKSAKAYKQWLQQNKLSEAPRLAETINVKSGWETALEAVLGNLLNSLPLHSYQQLDHLITDLTGQNTSFSSAFFVNSTDMITYEKSSLAAQIISPKALQGLVSHIYCADTLKDALNKQPSLNNGECLVTRDGVILGNNWLTSPASLNNKKNHGVLVRQKQIDATHTEITTLKNKLAKVEKSIDVLHDEQNSLEKSQSEHQLALNNLHREESQAQAVIHATTNRIKQVKTNQQRVSLEITDLESRHSAEQEAHKTATHLRNTALRLLDSLENEKLTLEGKDVPLLDNVNTSRQAVRLKQQQTQNLQIEVRTLKATQQSSQKQLNRFGERLNRLDKRKQKLLKENKQTPSKNDQQSLDKQLANALGKRATTEEKLKQSRDSLSSIDSQVRRLEQKRHQAETEVEKYRCLLETLKLEWQEVSVREETLQEQFLETGFDKKELQQEMQASISLQAQQTALNNIQEKVSRLGAINLAAIDEFKTQSERKVYLDQQDADLIAALETLESAIAKIDRDTRSRFKDTFEKVNTRIQEMFPQLFGGGKAHLELTGDDLLTTGITIMAQPPGKRLSSIHLMSGGEKALTAVALVFAIFELNPAPFCMLDEVDAPLDEANVGRFCELVRKISDRVQFIFITHSKTTMELADNLVGVTMREPGISRLVSVDINQATQMVQD